MSATFIFALLAPVLLAAVPPDLSRPTSAADVPPPLRSWIGWALHGREGAHCPFLDGSNTVRCAWPSQLTLTIDEHDGSFTQSWRVEARSWVPLPGDAHRWPERITVDGSPGIVVPGANSSPWLELQRGDHLVGGSFMWDAPPKSLPIPVETGLLRLTVRGKAVELPQRDGGTLWLERSAEPVTEGDRLKVAVQRLVTDEVPMRLVTRIELGVSGKSREEVLGRALPPGFVPLSLDSQIPVRIESNSRLRVQVPPGTWVVVLTAVSEHQVNELARPAPEGTWCEDQEVWAFEARPQLRRVTVGGVEPVDPQQTRLPEEWKKFPAFPMTVGAALTFIERGRGDAAPPPDQLSLSRELWLDFDGSGTTVRDTITGQLKRAWRVEMSAPLKPGRISVNDRNMLITRGEDGRAGVELRQGTVRISADSRLEDGVGDLPATGWASDFRSVAAVMHLPPGWRLLHASGVDEVSSSWLGSFSLLDLFLTLVIALAAWRLLGVGWGIVALITLALSVTEPGAPRWSWLLVLAVQALVRILSEGWPRKAIRYVHGVLASVLALIVALFVLGDLQAGLFPAVVKDPAERISIENLLGTNLDFGSNLRSMFATSTNALTGSGDTKSSTTNSSLYKHKSLHTFGQDSGSSPAAPVPVQTGPGIPTWEQHNTTVHLTWNGPVPAGQRLRLVLLGPKANLLLSLLRSGLVALLLLALLRFPGRFWPKRLRSSVLPGVLLLVGLIAPRPAAAQMPEPEMIKELGDRLMAPPECAPNCASIPRLTLEVGPVAFTARLQAVAAAATAIPLPGTAPDLAPDQVLLDGRPASALARDNEGRLWIAIAPGWHQIVATGRLPVRDSLPIALPLLPHRVEARVEGWRLDGLHEDGLADGALLLSRLGGTQAPTALEVTALPPQVRIERTIVLDLKWRTETRVVRLSPPGSPAVIEVPLLDGESVTSGVRVAAGRVLVNLGPTQNEVSWESVLEEHSPLRLVAPSAAGQTEVWRLEVGSTWHVTLDGIPPAHNFTEDGARRPEWWPWPGEAVTITVTRPEGLAGQVLTIDASNLELWPREHSSQALLELSLRSSRSGEHSLLLPTQAVLEEVKLNGVAQDVHQEGRRLVLPITSGSQSYQIGWRQPETIQMVIHGIEVDLGIASVNSDAVIHLPQDRWILAVSGARLGPSVQLWAFFVVLLIFALALGRFRSTPLRTRHWFLLALGCTQLSWAVGMAVAGTLLLLGWRSSRPDLGKAAFSLRQVAILALGLIALILLLSAVISSLGGHPNMGVTGNDSSNQLLRWTTDRAGSLQDPPWVLTLPLWAWRLAMLAWGLWLCFALVGWCRWGFRTFTGGGGVGSILLKREPSPPHEPSVPPKPAGEG